MDTNGYSAEKSEGDVYVNTETDFISLSRYERTELIFKIVYYLLMIIFRYFMLLVWTWIYIDRDSYWSWIIRKISQNSHSNLVLVLSHKPPNPFMNCDCGQTSVMEIRLDI